MTKVGLIGAGGHCRAVIAQIEAIGSMCIEGIIDPFFSGVEEIILGYSVIGGIADIDKYFAPDRVVLCLAIGELDLRKRLSACLGSLGYEFASLIHPTANVHRSASAGKGVYVGSGAHLGPCSRLGSFCIVNTGANVEHEASIGDYCHLAPGSIICGRSELERDTFVGAGAVILENLQIASGCIIGAGTIVRRTCKVPGSKIVGPQGRIL